MERHSSGPMKWLLSADASGGGGPVEEGMRGICRGSFCLLCCNRRQCLEESTIQSLLKNLFCSLRVSLDFLAR